ncbi:MAG: diguanylate cyclase [Pseudomonadota bacterium]
MSMLELVIWSMAAGAMGLVLLFNLAELVSVGSAAILRGVSYHLLSIAFVVLLSGLAQALWPAPPDLLQVAQVLIGPFTNALGNYWARGWLSAQQRDSLLNAALRLATWVPPAAGLVCLTLPQAQQLPASAAICLLNSALGCWLMLRGFLLGDRLALGMAVATGLGLPAIGGLYALASGVSDLGPALQALVALCVVLSNSLVAVMIWLRRHPHVLARSEAADPLLRDPLTNLHSSVALVQRLIKAQRRRRRTRRDGAVIAVVVFDIERVVAQAGSAGANQLFVAIASRIQRQVGVMNPVGRYWDRCFVSVVEAIHSPAWLRTVGLRVSVSLRRPIEVTGLDGRRLELRADIGVGVVHLSSAQKPVEDILHDAQRMAEAARRMRSRAATMNPGTREVVPIEEANLGPSRQRHPHPHPNLVPHAVPAVVQRPTRS